MSPGDRSRTRATARAVVAVAVAVLVSGIDGPVEAGAAVTASAVPRVTVAADDQVRLRAAPSAVKVGRPVKLRVTASQTAFGGARARLQARRNGRWVTVSRRSLSKRAAGDFRLRVTSPGSMLVRVVVAGRRGARARSLPVRIMGTARRSVKSRGGTVRVRLGALEVVAGKGAIRRGERLSIQAGDAGGFPALGTHSVAGGPYVITTSQGQPKRPLKVSLRYDPGLLSPGGSPVVVHGTGPPKRWLPEPTRADRDRRQVTATLDSLSPIDVVDGFTWAAGLVTGNRTDLPDGCGAAPPWIDGAIFPRARHDALPACVSERTDATTLYVNVVNNRGYAQLVEVAGASVRPELSAWGGSVAGTLAAAVASRTQTRATQTLLLTPGQRATLAFSRPEGLVGPRQVRLVARSHQASALVALVWEFANVVGLDAVGVTDCALAGLDVALSAQPSSSTVLGGVSGCLTTAGGLSTALRAKAQKVAAGLLTTSAFYKLTDILADEAYPPTIEFVFKGASVFAAGIHVDGLDLGTLEDGAMTERRLVANGGTPPYRFSISTAAENAGRVPAWAELGTDGVLRLRPPAGTSGRFGFFVRVTDASGRSTPFARDEVTFSIAAPGLPSRGRIDSGHQHVCAVRPSGAGACWGENPTGLGDAGATTRSNRPTAVAEVGDFAGISAGRPGVTCGWTRGGRASCWGDNGGGMLGAGIRSEDLRSSATPVAVAGLTGVTEVSSGDGGSCAVDSAGSAYCWGDNAFGRLGTGRDQHSLPSANAPEPVVGERDTVTISAGMRAHRCLLRRTGTVACWGYIDHHGAGLGDGVSVASLTPVTVAGIDDAIDVSTGGWHSCALRRTGAVVCWGDNYRGALGDGSALSTKAPVKVLGIDDAIAIGAGTAHTCALRRGGSVSCWGGGEGAGSVIALGNGVNGNSLRPVTVAGLTDAVAISAGEWQTCALRAAGSAACWGAGQSGQLGDGSVYTSSTNPLVPVSVVDFP